jgi:hypothetical protein
VTRAAVMHTCVRIHAVVQIVLASSIDQADARLRMSVTLRRSPTPTSTSTPTPASTRTPDILTPARAHKLPPLLPLQLPSNAALPPHYCVDEGEVSSAMAVSASGRRLIAAGDNSEASGSGSGAGAGDSVKTSTQGTVAEDDLGDLLSGEIGTAGATSANCCCWALYYTVYCTTHCLLPTLTHSTHCVYSTRPVSLCPAGAVLPCTLHCNIAFRAPAPHTAPYPRLTATTTSAPLPRPPPVQRPVHCSVY